MTNKGGQPNNNNARIGNVNRVQWHGTVAQETLDAIRRLSHETGKSQSEVVDRAMRADRLLKELAMLVDAGMIVRGSIAGDAIIDRIETWKEQSQ